MNKDSLAQSLLLKDRIAELRKEKGLSQVALAKQLDVDSSTIAKYETGDRFPDVIMLMKLADFSTFPSTTLSEERIFNRIYNDNTTAVAAVLSFDVF